MAAPMATMAVVVVRRRTVGGATAVRRAGAAVEDAAAEDDCCCGGDRCSDAEAEGGALGLQVRVAGRGVLGGGVTARGG